MADKPLISVIVPVYGVEAYIEGCILSIINQTMQDFELILVDDGSKDDSIAIAKRALSKSNVNYLVIAQTNQGQGLAREAGIKKASGKWVVFIDSDDTVTPNYLEVLHSIATYGSADIAMVSYKMVSINMRYSYDKPQNGCTHLSRDNMLYRFLVRNAPPILPAMLIKRSLFMDNDIWLNTRCRFSEDVYIMWKLFAVAKDISYQPDALYNYLVRPNSTMTSAKKENIITGYYAIREMSENFSEIYDGFELQHLILPRWVLGALRSTAQISRYKEFCKVADVMDYKTNTRALKKFPEIKARVLADILACSKMIFYIIIKCLSHI